MDYLTKPFSPVDLVNAVRHVLETEQKDFILQVHAFDENVKT